MRCAPLRWTVSCSLDVSLASCSWIKEQGGPENKTQERKQRLTRLYHVKLELCSDGGGGRRMAESIELCWGRLDEDGPQPTKARAGRTPRQYRNPQQASSNQCSRTTAAKRHAWRPGGCQWDISDSKAAAGRCAENA